MDVGTGITLQFTGLCVMAGLWFWVKTRGMLLDQFAVATQAAISGLGVALLPRFLIEAELARGDLVEAVCDAQPIESAERYYLAWPMSRSSYPPLQAFRQWICAAALLT